MVNEKFMMKKCKKVLKMRYIVGLINKRKKEIIDDLKKICPEGLKNHTRLIFIGDNYYPVTNFNEIKPIGLNEHMGIIYCFPNLDDNNFTNFQKYEDSINDYILFYGNLWKPEKDISQNKKMNHLDGNYVLIVKKGSEIKISKDIVGIKQMYYGENSSFVGFSSRRSPLNILGIKTIRLLPGETIKLTTTGIKQIEHKTLKKPNISIFNEKIAIEKYKKTLVKAVKKRINDVNKVGIIFSGGVDSAMIAKIADTLGKAVKCYCSGLSRSTDIIAAEDSADSLRLPIEILKLSTKRIKNILPKIISIIENWNQLQVEAALPVYYAMEQASMDGIKVVLNGQGADELFAGYDWYPNLLKQKGKKAVIEHMWEDLLLGYKETFERENKLAEFQDLELRVPYCDLNVIKTAMNISLNLKTKIDDDMRKYVHRRVAEELDVPLSIAWREKDAAQHASGVHDIIKNIANDFGYIENNKYELKTTIEKLGSVYRYGNDYRTDVDEYGDNFVQSYFEDIAIDLGIVG